MTSSATISQLLNSGANLTIQVTTEQLREAFRLWGADLLNAVRPEPTEQYLTINEVCEQMRVCKSTVMKWQRSGWIKPVRQGGVTRYRQSDLDNFNKSK